MAVALGLLMIVGAAALAWKRGPGPRRRRIARLAWVICLLALVSNAGQPAAQRSAFLNDMGVLGTVGLGVGLLWTRGRRQAAGTWR